MQTKALDGKECSKNTCKIQSKKDLKKINIVLSGRNGNEAAQ